jgi:F-type H+-transporting ATPase subunit delta
MKITKQARREARQLFRTCRVNGLLDENRARQVVRLVAGQKPRGYMGVLEQFERLVRLDVAQRLARVETAMPLEPGFQTQLRADLSRVYGGGLDLEFSTKPELLGGMRVQVGGDVYDGSVLARLTALKESF